MTTAFPTMSKLSLDQMPVKPNLEYDRDTADFSWDSVAGELDWLPGGLLNKAHEAIDRHANGRRRDKIAMIWEGKNGGREDYTFGQMKTLSNKFANVLKSLGVEKGDRVFIFMDRVPELYIALFGILKIDAIAGPLFSAFGPDPVKDRMKDSGTKVLITQPDLRRRISGVISELFDLQHIIVVNKNNRDSGPMEMADLNYDEEMDKASPDFDIAPTSQYDYSIMHLHFGHDGKTQGGRPPAPDRDTAVRHGQMGPGPARRRCLLVYRRPRLGHRHLLRDAGSLTNGVTQLVYEGGFRASGWYERLQKHKVTVWYTAPTAIRMPMKAGDDVPKRYDLSKLRYMCSVGEPLNPEAVMWGQSALGMPFHDNWWQTETGAILVANYPGMGIRLGSMGRLIPVVEVAIFDDDFNPAPPETDGNLAIRPGWPAMFHTYWNNADMYNTKFRKGWYITGDWARVDEDGYEATNELKNEITRFSRQKLSAAVAPREIEFTSSLPKTRSGKIMRRLLKTRELGLPEGDTSTLEED